MLLNTGVGPSTSNVNAADVPPPGAGVVTVSALATPADSWAAGTSAVIVVGLI